VTSPKSREIVRHVIAATVGLTLIATPLVLVFWGCKEDSPKIFLDGPISNNDGGSGCDMIANKWRSQTLKAVAATGIGEELATFFGVWGASEKEIFAVGTRGKAISYNGTEWKSTTTPTTEMLTAVWGTAANDVWAVGFNGTVIQYDGAKWIDRSPGDILFVTTDGGVPKGDAAVGLRKNLWGVWATGTVDPNTKKGLTSDVFAVGDNGLILHFDNKLKLWSKGIPIYAGGTLATIQDQLNAVWGASPTAVFVAGNFGTILLGSKTRFDQHTTKTTKDLNGIWGRSSSEVYAVGNTGTILRYTGSATWTSVTGAPKQVLRAIWGPANNSSLTYVIGWDGTLLQLSGGPGFGNGATVDPFYCIVPSRRLEGIWGTLVPPPPPDSGADIGNTLVPAVWIVGSSGTVITGP